MTNYLVQIKCDDGYETVRKTSVRSKAMLTGYELAQEMHDGRVITEKGYVAQEWSVHRDE